MKNTIKIVLALISAIGFSIFPVSAFALCNQSSASQADRDLWGKHGCYIKFFEWSAKAYKLESGDMKNRGWNDACNVNLEFPKHWNAAYLITYGLEDNFFQSFHMTSDYRGISEGASNKFHSTLRHTIKDGNGLFGSFMWHPVAPNVVTTYCLLYDSSKANANPASRAGDYVHEGWHAWLDYYNWDNGSSAGHRSGPQGKCTISSGCDYFYFHKIIDYRFYYDMWDGGRSFQMGATPNQHPRHTPNQAQVEFLCDVADLSKSWVPESVRIAARADANQRAVTRFINGPGYTCGSARPWS